MSAHLKLVSEPAAYQQVSFAQRVAVDDLARKVAKVQSAFGATSFVTAATLDSIPRHLDAIERLVAELRGSLS
jgi:hypothetical protein